MITIYHLHQSRSDRILWLLEELGEPYELIEFKRLASGMAPPEYRALHPMGTSPVVRDGDLMLTETGGIVEHLVDHYGKGRLSPDPASNDYARYLQWLHFAEGSAAFSILTEAILAPTLVDGKLKPGRAQVWRDRNDRMMPWLDEELGLRPYFAGDRFSAADIMMNYNFGLFERFLGRSLEEFVNIADYRGRMQSRPAYLKAQHLAYPDGHRTAANNPFARR